MSEDRAPGVYVEEVSFRSSSIPGVAVAALPLLAVLVGYAVVRLRRRHRGVSAAGR